jgi:hypothetical protein
MRLPLLACLILAAGIGPAYGAAFARAHARPRFHPPTHCPELRSDGFCHYDSFWRPAADNPLFSPLRPGDPQGRSGPLCTITDSRGRILLGYETENEAPAMRIGGRLVRFRPAGGDRGSFVSAAGRLSISEGAVVARDHESDGRRATLTFTDRRGRAHRASVRIDCGV